MLSHSHSFSFSFFRSLYAQQKTVSSITSIHTIHLPAHILFATTIHCFMPIKHLARIEKQKFTLSMYVYVRNNREKNAHTHTSSNLRYILSNIPWYIKYNRHPVNFIRLAAKRPHIGYSFVTCLKQNESFFRE